MEQASSSQLENYYRELENLSDALSKAGIYIKGKHLSHDPRGRVIFDFIIDRPCSDEVFIDIYKKLSKNNYIVLQLRVDNNYVIRIAKYEKTRDTFKRILLFTATFVTIWLTGYYLSEGYYYVLGKMINTTYSTHVLMLWSTLYTILFLAALGAHEYGHIIASRRYGVPISGPYFIPAPPAQLGFIGTLGSIISMKSLPPSRRSLLLIGLMGPLLGFLSGLIVSVFGVLLSIPIHYSEAVELIEAGEAGLIPFMPMALAILISLRAIGEEYTLLLHPMAFVGFVIFIVTFFNLMPIGQLDGGHVVRAFTSHKLHNLIGYIVVTILMLAGLALFQIGGQIYLFMGIVLSIFKLIFGSKPHPGPANMFSKISKQDYALLVIYVILIILCVPIPML